MVQSFGIRSAWQEVNLLADPHNAHGLVAGEPAKVPGQYAFYVRQRLGIRGDGVQNQLVGVDMDDSFPATDSEDIALRRLFRWDSAAQVGDELLSPAMWTVNRYVGA